MDDLREGMIEAALCAAEAIMDIYEDDFDVEMKGDETPVTRADRLAEDIIINHLMQLAPSIPIIAEESVAAGRVPEIEDRFFLVDPIDGTKEFICRNGEFTVNIALIDNQLPTLGVIYTPAKGWLFVGERGKGAWRAEVKDPRNGHWIENKQPISMRKDTGKPLDVVKSRSHHTSEAQAFLSQFDLGGEIAVGSSLKFCLLAAGEADLYPRFGRTMEWDTAAGDAILSAAGGTVLTLSGNRLLYGKTIGAGLPFENPDFIAKRA